MHLPVALTFVLPFCFALFTYEFSSSVHLCKIWSSNILTSTLWKSCVILCTYKHGSYQKIYMRLQLGKIANKDPNEMANIFNKTMSNVLNNYIPHETLVCGDQDPPWINNKVKNVIQEKNQPFSDWSNTLVNFKKMSKWQNDSIYTTYKSGTPLIVRLQLILGKKRNFLTLFFRSSVS